MTADRNDPGSRGEENGPHDPGTRDGDTRRLPAQEPASTGTGAYGGPYAPGGPGWNAPGWTPTASGPTAPTAEHPRPGRAARLTRAARSKPLQITAAALIGAVIGGGAVAVVDAVGDRHRDRAAFTRTDERRGGDGERHGTGHDRGGWGDRYGYRNGPGGSADGSVLPDASGGHLPGDGFRAPDACEPTGDGLRCTLPYP
ncbi:hypothetical protein GCM10010466_03530 [Planomonospora alba]|uniref:Uncharacterized protein n=1 Tax=Planomonospora alba TaxID=161354 RepID=A0ABP6MK28_9ACTN